MAHTIHINGMRFYAYHGCLEEEARIGGEYIVDVRIESDFSKAADSDELADTVDYCKVYELCKTEMSVRSKLIETVCKRISDALKREFHAANIEVALTKLRPPIGGNVESVTVRM